MGVIQSALEGIVPQDHIYGTEFIYNAAGEIESLVRATAGYGKVAALDQLQAELQIGPDHIIYTGDGLVIIGRDSLLRMTQRA